MHAYIITGGNRKLRIDKITDLSHEFSANKFDKVALGSEDLSSIGIADVREFQKSMMLAPAFGEIRLGIINFAESLTVEAQQALLKTLEEPPKHAKIILETEIASALLPTVTSRCQMIILEDKTGNDFELWKNSYQTIEKIIKSSKGKRLQLVDELFKNRSEGLIWTETAIAAVREQLLTSVGKNSETEQLTWVLKRLIEAQRELQANVNFHLVLDNLFLEI